MRNSSMDFHILTLFPEMVMGGLNTSITGRAMEKGLISVEAINIRDYSHDKHHHVDDAPYGGGAGMVMQPGPICEAYEDLCGRLKKKPRVIYMTPQGRVFNQTIARELAMEEDLVFLCGHYEGIDERALELICTDYLSIGDYVVTGGELPAMVVIDCVSRLVPGVLNNEVSAETESFHDNLLEYPQYTRPEVFRDMAVPPVLLTGHHQKIEEWRRCQSIRRTFERRPDLLEGAVLTKKEKKYLDALRAQAREQGNEASCGAWKTEGETAFSRTALLLGDEGLMRLKKARVAIFGIGGVGGYVAEALARSGVGSLELIDSDRIALSNLNRQIIATLPDLGRCKVDVMKERILSINPEAKVEARRCFFLPETAQEFDFSRYTYVVDAVDTVAAKIQIIMQAKAAGVPVISSMGAGNKLDPSRFMVADIYDTSVCPLARVMRRELRKRGVGELKVVYSTEEPMTPGAARTADAAGVSPRTPGSVAFVPSAAGLILAGQVVRDICTEGGEGQ